MFITRNMRNTGRQRETANLRAALTRNPSTLEFLSSTEVHGDAYHRVRLAHRALPETVTHNADNQTLFDATSPFQYLKVGCWGMDNATNVACTNIINRDGNCSNPSCSAQDLPPPADVPMGSCFRMRIDTAYDVPQGEGVPAQPPRFFQNLFVSDAAYQTLRLRYNMVTPPETRINFPETPQQVWVDGFVRAVNGPAQYENTIYTLFPQDVPIVAIVAQFTPAPYANRAKIHFLTIKDFLLPPLLAQEPPAAPLPLPLVLDVNVNAQARAPAAAALSANDVGTAPLVPAADTNAPARAPTAAAAASSTNVSAAPSVPAAPLTEVMSNNKPKGKKQ